MHSNSAGFLHPTTAQVVRGCVLQCTWEAEPTILSRENVNTKHVIATAKTVSQVLMINMTTVIAHCMLGGGVPKLPVNKQLD